MTIFSKAFAIDAGERVASTFFQGFVATLAVTSLSGDALQAAGHAAIVGGIAAALSTLKAIAANLPSTTSAPAPAAAEHYPSYAQYPTYEQQSLTQ